MNPIFLILSGIMLGSAILLLMRALVVPDNRSWYLVLAYRAGILCALFQLAGK